MHITKKIAIVAALVLFVPFARAQGVVSEMLAGKLVDPAVGQWAWYD